MRPTKPGTVIRGRPPTLADPVDVNALLDHPVGMLGISQ
jgi:hypothetical protein